MSYLENINQEPNFKVGDKVKCIDVNHNHELEINKQYTVTRLEYDIHDPAWFVALKEVDEAYGCDWFASRFEKVNQGE